MTVAAMQAQLAAAEGRATGEASARIDQARAPLHNQMTPLSYDRTPEPSVIFVLSVV